MLSIKHHLEEVDGVVGIVLDEDLVIPSIFGHERSPYVVPKNFWTDGASIPWLAQPLIGPPFSSKYAEEAILHDWLCTLADSYGKRVVADGVFLVKLRDKGIEVWRRYAMFFAVSSWAAWKWMIWRHVTGLFGHFKHKAEGDDEE